MSSAVEMAGAVVGAIVILFSALGAAAAIFRANKAQTTIKVLQDLTDALERQNKQQQGQLDQQDETIKALRRQNDDLKEMVQSRAAVEALSKQMAANHRELLEAMRGAS